MSSSTNSRRVRYLDEMRHLISCVNTVRDAQQDGDVASNLEPEVAAEFLIANIAGIRVAGRGGANRAALTGLADIALKALC